MESFLELKNKDLLMPWAFLFWKLIYHHRKMKKKAHFLYNKFWDACFLQKQAHIRWKLKK